MYNEKIPERDLEPEENFMPYEEEEMEPRDMEETLASLLKSKDFGIDYFVDIIINDDHFPRIVADLLKSAASEYITDAQPAVDRIRSILDRTVDRLVDNDELPQETNSHLAEVFAGMADVFGGKRNV